MQALFVVEFRFDFVVGFVFDNGLEAVETIGRMEDSAVTQADFFEEDARFFSALNQPRSAYRVDVALSRLMARREPTTYRRVIDTDNPASGHGPFRPISHHITAQNSSVVSANVIMMA